jgi:hypothetical protein
VLAAGLLFLFFNLPPRSTVNSLGKPRRVDDAESPLDPAQRVIKSKPGDLSYREHLDTEHAPHPFTEHSPTLTFSRIYILSLPFRTDRRARMTKLMHALGLEFEFVDATSKDAPIIKWIGERAAEVRRRKREVIADGLGVLPEEVGGTGIGSIWLEPSRPLRRVVNPGKPRKTEPKQYDFPSLVDERFGGTDWVSFLESDPTGFDFTSSDDSFNVTEAMWDPFEENAFRQINDAVIATWYSQTRVWKLMQKNGDESALILEDDVDIEWDIDRIWPNIWRRLPTPGNGKVEPWQVTFLGHCWGRELTSEDAVALLLYVRLR